MHKLCWILSLFLFSQFAFANTCPSIETLKKGDLSDWNFYDTDDNKPLSSKRIAQYKTDAVAFALAEWTSQDREGTIHCLYHDKAGSDMEAYLAKNHVQLSSVKKFWYDVSGSQQCAAGMHECEFKEIDTSATHLAHN